METPRESILVCGCSNQAYLEVVEVLQFRPSGFLHLKINLHEKSHACESLIAS